MIWNLNCRKTRRLLALSAGNDFEGPPAPETQRHLAVCPHCRETWQGLLHSQKVFERVSAVRNEGQGPDDRAGVSDRSPLSIWPGVARHLRVIDEQSSAPNWRGWLPAGALVAACLGIVLVTIPDPRFGVRTAENREPRVIYSQPALDESQGLGFQRSLGTVPEWDRDRPEVGRESPVQLLPGDDEPRSF